MKKKILIIDDDKIICKVTKRMFQIANLADNPITFTSGKEALSFLKENQCKEEEYLVFLDINMPTMSGWDFIENMEREHPQANTTIYLITSSIDPTDHKRAKANKYVTDILIKPITFNTVIELKKRIAVC